MGRLGPIGDLGRGVIAEPLFESGHGQFQPSLHGSSSVQPGFRRM
jgi:hypothetical protein